MSFSSLSATSRVRARMPEPKFLLAWACLTQHLPLSKFLTSSGVCFSRTLAALFHAAATPRVSTPGNTPTCVAASRGRTLALPSAFTPCSCHLPPKRHKAPHRGVVTPGLSLATPRCRITRIHIGRLRSGPGVHLQVPCPMPWRMAACLAGLPPKSSASRGKPVLGLDRCSSPREVGMKPCSSDPFPCEWFGLRGSCRPLPHVSVGRSDPKVQLRLDGGSRSGTVCRFRPVRRTHVESTHLVCF